ncbi:MAG TPA: phosphatase PAP2 family protein [Candidatus Baltobacteraceae bacterium]|nr:phosphatase PAP2 family protein [Candidatus Baltobacteraceae bacterium]
MTVHDREFFVSLVCFLLFAILGVAIIYRPRVLWDVHAKYFLKQSTPVALFFTRSGRSRQLLAGYTAAVIIYMVAHLNVWVPLVMALSQITSQMVVEAFKLVYKRVRPDYFLHQLDKGRSYPSGHATTAVVSYVGWALIAAHSALPHDVKWAIAGALVVWAMAIDWSRLALGAHYFSDVFGGTLFGTAWLCAILGFSGNLLLTP